MHGPLLMNQVMTTKIVTFYLVLPITIVSIPLLILGAVMWPFIIYQMGISDIFNTISNPGKWTIGELVPLAVPFGIWGLLTLWQLALHYIKNAHTPNNIGMKYLGLLLGGFSSVQLAVNIFSKTDRGGSWLGYVFLLSLVCGVYFFYLLITSNKERQSSANTSAE